MMGVEAVGSNKVELSIIVISYNTKKMTLECIESVLKETKNTSFELIVFDNDSKDGSSEAIKEAFPSVTLIESKDNLGFARANNKVIEDVSSEFLLLLNPDTIVLDGAIDKLMAFSKVHPNAGIWGGKTLFGDRTLNPGSCFGKMTPWNQFCRASGLAAVFKNSEFFNSENYGGWKRDTERAVDIVCGCFFLIKRETWNKLGGFEKKYFMYAEEADLCLRAKTLGCKPMVTPEAVIVHYGGGSESVRADKMVRLLRAKVTLAKDHWPAIQKPFASFFLQMWVAVRVVSYSCLLLLPGKREEQKKARDSWAEIWRRSNEWAGGYKSDV